MVVSEYVDDTRANTSHIGDDDDDDNKSESIGKKFILKWILLYLLAFQKPYLLSLNHRKYFFFEVGLRN